MSLTDDGVGKLLNQAIALHGEELVDEHIKSTSDNAVDLSSVQLGALEDGSFSVDHRTILGKAASTKRAGWFKSVTWLEDVARDIVGPDIAHADEGFVELVEDVFAWAADAGD